MEKILPIFQQTNISKPYVYAINRDKEKVINPRVPWSHTAKHIDFLSSFCGYKFHTFANFSLLSAEISIVKGSVTSESILQVRKSAKILKIILLMPWKFEFNKVRTIFKNDKYPTLKDCSSKTTKAINLIFTYFGSACPKFWL